MGFLQALMVLGSSFSLAIGALKASKTLHNSMLANVLRSPMSFFDTTPLGRILNRFSKVSLRQIVAVIFSISKDIYMIDEVIPRSLAGFLMTFMSVVATIIIISIASPWFLAVIVPLIILYILVQVKRKI